MKKFFQDIKVYSEYFRNYIWRYLLLFIGLELFDVLLIIPIFRALATITLQASAIPFISYQNIITILTTHSLVALALLLELICLILIIYGQFTFLMVAVKNISLSFNKVLLQTWIAVKRIRLGSLLLLMAYFVLIIPFADLVFRTPLLAKIQIPEFILDYMMRKPVCCVSMLIIYSIILILGARLLLTLPIMAFEGRSSWSAMKKSWKLTSKKTWWAIISRLIAVSVLSIGILAAYDGSLLLCQFLWNTWGKSWNQIFIYLNLLLVQFGSVLVLTWSGVVSFFIIFQPLHLQLEYFNKKSLKINWRFCIISLVVYLVAISSATCDNVFYLQQFTHHRPLIISHRGVSAKNGVQNTITALKKTAKLHPDYVEIDVHETKDNQFVVMHDENLKQLAKVNKKPKELTLKQLEKIKLREDGHQAKIASLDNYLKAANRFHQKLLIEIKTTPQDSKLMLSRFNQKYGSLIKHRRYQVQSLDYSVIECLHKLDDQIFVLYIQPYNFTYPYSLADGYAMEYSTLNSDFITQAHFQHKPVYAWTVNNSGVMKQMMIEGVDGIITDNVSLLRRNIKNFEGNHSTVSQLLNYIIVLPNLWN